MLYLPLIAVKTYTRQMMEDMYELIKDVPQRVSYEKHEPWLKTGEENLKEKKSSFKMFSDFVERLHRLHVLGVKSSDDELSYSFGWCWKGDHRDAPDYNNAVNLTATVWREAVAPCSRSHLSFKTCPGDVSDLHRVSPRRVAAHQLAPQPVLQVTPIASVWFNTHIRRW